MEMELALNIENNHGTKKTNGRTERRKENRETGGKLERKEKGKEKVTTTTTAESSVNGARPWLSSSVSPPPGGKAELPGRTSGCHRERFFYLCTYGYN